MSEGSPKLIAIDEQPDDEIVHTFRLGETDRPTYQPLDPRTQVDVLTLDLLRVFLSNRVLLCRHMPLVGPPTVGEIARDTKEQNSRSSRRND
jgi:hypothetical protein